MVEGVKDTFIQRLKQLDWMDEATKRKGHEKVCMQSGRAVQKHAYLLRQDQDLSE